MRGFDLGLSPWVRASYSKAQMRVVPGLRLDMRRWARGAGQCRNPRGTQIRMPAMQAVIIMARVPPIIARKPRRARSARRSGAMPPMPPIWMPMLPKFAKGNELPITSALTFGLANNSVSNNFIRVPDVCKVTFMRGGNVNTDVTQYKMCAITQVDVNYTPDGTYATYDDGSMVAIQLSLSFQESKLIFSEEADKY